MQSQAKMVSYMHEEHAEDLSERTKIKLTKVLTNGYESFGRTNSMPSTGLRRLYAICTTMGANSGVNAAAFEPGVCGSGVDT